MNDYRVLRALDRARFLFERMGVDYPLMRRILGLKLTLDGRRTTGAAALFGSKSKSSSWSLGKGSGLKPKDQPDEGSGIGRTLFFYGLYGALSSMFLLLGGPYMLQAGIVLSVLLFVMMTAMLSDFSSVMLDVRDKPILHTKPVDGRTLGMAKALHILIYFTQFALALGIVPVAVGVFRYGAGFGLLLLLSLMLGGLLVAVFTAFVYLLVLKLFDGETLKDMINYVQIGMTIFMLVGYQIAIRALDFSRFTGDFRAGWWELALPPLWYSAGFEWLLNGRGEPIYQVPALLGLVVPLLGAFVFYKMMPGFERSLEKLSGTVSRRRGSRVKRWNRMWANLLCRNAEERAFYVFAASMLAGEREFKLKVYPSLGFSLVVPFIFLFSFAAAGSGGLASIDFAGGVAYLNVYACAIMIPTLVLMMKYSGSFKGGWIYTSAPIRNIDAVYRATLKAMFARLFLPLFLVESIVFVLLFGVRIVPDLLVMLAVSVLLLPLTLRMLERELPFSLPFPSSSDQSGGIKTIGIMMLLGVFATLHYAAVAFMPAFGIWVLLALAIGANIWAWSGTLFKSD
ncbi:hypothetical protein [Saccharibacillus alkalitolerans]|uniref:ABC transporter permease n=1 Tax=Saccharibacillus alkalitolerans TaxID=2705290 RepID=A0ABX0F9V6_9BACL|nr:hypothetical protein [Saccharibacillus alkalitolerans]NGZ76259.1 hypothetical protein [Saccharibacillus alkalitolerans]